MKKKSLVLAAALAACAASVAFATPQTSWDKGQFQVDLGGWNVKTDYGMSTLSLNSNRKWNFAGGLTYGLSDTWALQYAYHGLDTDWTSPYNEESMSQDGKQHEVNLLYSAAKNVALFAGWSRINFSLYNSTESIDKTNNIAQFGIIAKAPINDKFDLYAKGALGTKKTTMWEAGLGYTPSKDLDVNVGYRYVNTEWNSNSVSFNDIPSDITFKGFTAGLSYRFGGGHKAAPVEAPAPEPAPVVEQPVVAAPVQKLDYYLDSIHFDFDVDTPMASEQPKLNNFVSVAKANPDNLFKLVGNTDAKGTDTYNNDLSKRRVANVAKYAVDNGVSANQLKAMYRGETDPVSTNDTDQGRADNRRVDIYMNK